MKFQNATKEINGRVQLVFSPNDETLKIGYENAHEEFFYNCDSPIIGIKDLLPNIKLDGKDIYSTAIRRIVASASDMMAKCNGTYQVQNPFHVWCKKQIPQECYDELAEKAKLLEFV